MSNYRVVKRGAHIIIFNANTTKEAVRKAIQELEQLGCTISLKQHEKESMAKDLEQKSRVPIYVHSEPDEEFEIRRD